MEKPNSIAKSVGVLKLLGDGTNRFSDIQKELVFSKSTAHRILKNLEYAGLVIQDPVNKKYYISNLILMLASKPNVSHQRLILCSLNELNYLKNLSGETIMIIVRMGDKKVIIEEFPSDHEIKLTRGKGFCSPIYTGASGKMLLSKLNDHDLTILLKNIRLKPVGPNTITNRNTLLKEIQKIKKQGFSTSFGEGIKGSASISVHIKNEICPYALTIMGPDNRFKPLNILEALKESTVKISKKFNSDLQVN